MKHRHPEDKLLSYNLVKKRLQELTGVCAIVKDSELLNIYWAICFG